MAYCTLADLISKIPESSIIGLSNDDPEVAEINMTNVTAAIAAADHEIDSYVSLVVALPVVPTPPLLNDLSAKMAIWNLHLRKYFNSEVWQKTYWTCQRILLRIAEGKLNINASLDGAAVDCIVAATRPQRFTETLWSTFR